MSSGYSATPLAKKLGYRPHLRVYLHQAPDHYPTLLEPLPGPIKQLSRLVNRLDFIHGFFTKT